MIAPSPAQALATRVLALAGNIDAHRWALAALAAEEMDKAAAGQGVREWAEIMGAVCRNSPRTVRGWAAAWRFRQQLEPAPDLPISFYDCAQFFADKVPEVDILNLLDTAASEAGVTVEAFRHELEALSGAEAAKSYSRALRRVASGLRRAAQLAENPRDSRRWDRLAALVEGRAA